MSKSTTNKALQVSEAVVWGVFIFAAFIGAAALLRPNLFTSLVTYVVAYILSAYAVLVLGYMLFKAVENK